MSSSSGSCLKPMLFIFSLLLIIVIEPLYREPLFEVSFSVIKNLQSTATPFSKDIFETISSIGGVGIIFGTLIVTFVFSAKSRSFYYIIYYSLMLYVMSVGKLAYHSPRPYMVDDDIQVYGCATEFGHPSGHSLNSMTFCIGLFLDFLATFPNTSQCNKATVGIAAIATPLLVGFSRLYNGDHTIDQIIYGWQLGIWIALLNHYCFRDFVFDHINKLTSTLNTFTSNDYTKFFFYSTCMFLACMGTLLMTFQIVDENFDVPTDWEQRLLEKCQKKLTLFSFKAASLIEGGAMALFLGGYYGMLYESYNLKGKSGSLGSSCCHIIMKLIVGVILCVPFLLPIFLMQNINDAYTATIYYTLIPTFGLGLVLYGLTDLVMLYFGCQSLQAKKEKEVSSFSNDYGYNVIVVSQ